MAKQFIDLSGQDQFVPEELKDYIRRTRAMLISYAAEAKDNDVYTLSEFCDVLWMLNFLSEEIDFVQGHKTVAH